MRTAAWTDSVSVLDRITAVLDAFGDDDRLGVSEIARRANLPKSTVSRIATDLVRQRYLDRDGDALQLGLRLFELGEAVDRPRRLRRIARPIMTRLHDLTGEAVALAVLDDDEIVVIAGAVGRGGMSAGDRAPAGTTALGAVLLAHRPVDAEHPSWREFADIRRSGVAVDTDTATGVACVASAVLERGADPVAAIAVSGSAQVVDVRRVGGVVRSAAAALSHRLNGERGGRSLAPTPSSETDDQSARSRMPS
jgi:IclR family acetate operon transcriptional repressor